MSYADGRAARLVRGLVLAASLGGLLVACGGGAGGTDSASTPVSPTSPPSVNPPAEEPPPVSPPVLNPPSITLQPASQTTVESASVTFTVQVQDGTDVSYQWLRNGAGVAGAQQSSYTLPAVVWSDDASTWSVRVANAAGTVVSSVATLTVTERPVQTPVGLSLFIGDESSPGYVDAQGRDARFSGAIGITTDPAGNVYVADSNNGIVRKVTPDGVVTALATNPAATVPPAFSFNCFGRANDLAFGGDGNLYVVDRNEGKVCRRAPNGDLSVAAASALVPGARYIARAPGTGLYVASATVIYRLESGGGVTLLAGQGPTPQGYVPSHDGVGAAAAFRRIVGITADAAGTVYVSDFDFGVRKVTPGGEVTTLATAADPAKPGFRRFTWMGRLALDTAGNVLLADSGAVDTWGGGGVFPWDFVVDFDGTYEFFNGFAGRIHRISPSGALTAVPGSQDLFLGGGPVGLASDSTGRIYYASGMGVGKLSADGVASQVAGRYLAGAGAPVRELAFAVDSAGNVMTWQLVGSNKPIIRRYTPGGRLVPFWTGRDRLELAAIEGSVGTFAIAMDAQDNLYAAYTKPITYANGVAIPATGRIFRLTPGGELQLVLATQQGDSNFVLPASLAIGPAGELYFADAARWGISKMDRNGIVTLLSASHSLIENNGLPDVPALAVNRSGKLYAVGHFLPKEFLRRQLYTLNASNQLEPLAGPGYPSGITDGVGNEVSFQAAGQPVLDAEGNIYMTVGSSVLRVTPTGVGRTVAGQDSPSPIQLGPLPGKLLQSWSGAMGADGTLYFQSGNAILKARFK